MITDINQEPPKIVFPCDYPIKVIGEAHEAFRATVIEVVRRHVESFDETTIELVDSRNGRFVSLRMVIRAEGESHIRGLFDEIKALPRIHMVL